MVKDIIRTETHFKRGDNSPTILHLHMKNILLTMLTLGLLASCTPPTPPVAAVKLSERDTIPEIVIDTNSVRTINLTGGKEIDLEITNEGIFLDDIVGKLSIQKTMKAEKMSITMTVENDSVTRFVVNSVVLVGEQEKGAQNVKKEAPVVLLDKNTVLVKTGATLSFISRYYNVSIGKLIKLNPNIKDKNIIQKNSKIIIGCDC